MADSKEQPSRFKFHDRTPNSMAWKLWLHGLDETDKSLLAKGQNELSVLLQSIRSAVRSNPPLPGTLPVSTNVIEAVLAEMNNTFPSKFQLKNGIEGFYSAIGIKVTGERMSRWDFSYDLQDHELPVRFFTMSTHKVHERYSRLVLGHISRISDAPLEAAEETARILAGNFPFAPSHVHPEPLSIRVQAPWDTYTFYALNFHHHDIMYQAWLAVDRKPVTDAALPPRWGNPA